MSKFRKKPVVIEAVQWSEKDGHQDVARIGAEWRERFPDRHETPGCDQCYCHMADHGTIPTLEGEHIVCPGDWIITGIKGEKYPCKPDIFAETYDPVTEEN